tara:strand:- start:316 stop:1107 length:792 start_codon:yes stop_codon:yes gene_type:complete
MTTNKRRTQKNGQATLQKREWKSEETWETKYLGIKVIEDDDRLKALAIFAECGRIGDVAEKLGLNRGSITTLISSDPDFAVAWADAYDTYRDKIERCMEVRALQGQRTPIVGGKDRDVVVAHEQKFETQLTLAFAKRHIPEYGERFQQAGVNIEAGVLVVGSNVASTGHDHQTVTPASWKKKFDTGGGYVAGELPLLAPPEIEITGEDLLEMESEETLLEKVTRLEAEIRDRAKKDERNASRRGKRGGEVSRRAEKLKKERNE